MRSLCAGDALEPPYGVVPDKTLSDSLSDSLSPSHVSLARARGASAAASHDSESKVCGEVSFIESTRRGHLQNSYDVGNL